MQHTLRQIGSLEDTVQYVRDVLPQCATFARERVHQARLLQDEEGRPKPNEELLGLAILFELWCLDGLVRLLDDLEAHWQYIQESTHQIMGSPDIASLMHPLANALWSARGELSARLGQDGAQDVISRFLALRLGAGLLWREIYARLQGRKSDQWLARLFFEGYLGTGQIALDAWQVLTRKAKVRGKGLENWYGWPSKDEDDARAKGAVVKDVARMAIGREAALRFHQTETQKIEQRIPANGFPSSFFADLDFAPYAVSLSDIFRRRFAEILPIVDGRISKVSLRILDAYKERWEKREPDFYDEGKGVSYSDEIRRVQPEAWGGRGPDEYGGKKDLAEYRQVMRDARKPICPACRVWLKRDRSCPECGIKTMWYGEPPKRGKPRILTAEERKEAKLYSLAPYGDGPGTRPRHVPKKPRMRGYERDRCQDCGKGRDGTWTSDSCPDCGYIQALREPKQPRKRRIKCTHKSDCECRKCVKLIEVELTWFKTPVSELSESVGDDAGLTRIWDAPTAIKRVGGAAGIDDDGDDDEVNPDYRKRTISSMGRLFRAFGITSPADSDS